MGCSCSARTAVGSAVLACYAFATHCPIRPTCYGMCGTELWCATESAVLNYVLECAVLSCVVWGYQDLGFTALLLDHDAMS
eukprot:2765148-Rhodomonas_salina.1